MERFVVFEWTEVIVYESISDESLWYNPRNYELPTDSSIFLTEELIWLKNTKWPCDELVIPTRDWIFWILNKDLHFIH